MEKAIMDKSINTTVDTINEPKVCLTKTQMENILDADREEPGACQTAKSWVNGFYPKKKESTLDKGVNFLGNYAERKVRSKARRKFKKWAKKIIEWI